MKLNSLLTGLLSLSWVALVTLSSFAQDAKLAPNSYLFDPHQSYDGFYIPVKKAYSIWTTSTLGAEIPHDIETAEVVWEDNHGLIITEPDYTLELIGTGENAKIKIPINKQKEGNAVIAYKVGGVIYWSWHVWVTDDPTNGTDYRSYDNAPILKRLNNNTLDTVLNNELIWMDRNLGAVSSKLTSEKWNKNGGLLYQWGRKDPIPPLALKGDDFYEVSGAIGRYRHKHARNFSSGNAASFETLKMYITKSNAIFQNNLQKSIHNPLSLIYIINDGDNNQAFYNNNPNLPFNWFGKDSSLTPPRLGELNLWSDNSKGIITPSNYNYNSQRRPYNSKSPYDPCPNGWRVPSAFIANLGNYSYIDDIRSDYFPYGFNTNTGINLIDNNVYPNDINTQSFKTGIKLYPNIGFNLSNVNGYNMGVFPGTGIIHRNANLHGSQYTDQHETHLWTATMTRWFDASPSVSARSLGLIPDAGQWINNYRPDSTNFPQVYGLYKYSLAGGETSSAAACRCISDPLYIDNGYDFPTEYFTNTTPTFLDGLYNPNSYLKTKKTTPQTIEIPVSKAFSVQSSLLGNPSILNVNNFNNLKVNVLWTTNIHLIDSVNITMQPISLSDLTNCNIKVRIKENQSGNAVITLHNNSINDPILWSWHIWISNSKVKSFFYQNDEPIADAVNYVNYVKKGFVLLTQFMDRNLGAMEAFPTVDNPSTVSQDELEKIRLSGGLQYQWGRKDPIPPFKNPDGSAYNIFLGNVDNNGSISYTTLEASSYNNVGNSYIVPYNTYSSSVFLNASDKVSTKIEKILTYSVQNPLVFMVPSNFAPSNTANRNLTNGTDWISSSTEPNLAADRWGRADKKSPFDPCPEGWRIPDVVSVSADSPYSNFPWGKRNVPQTKDFHIPTTYLGVKVNNYGFVFDNDSFKIGNYPFVGIRGYRNVLYGGSPSYLTSNQVTGIWTATLASNYLGRANALVLNKTYNILTVQDNKIDPYFAMNCRCVKVRLDEDGEETSPILEFAVDEYSTEIIDNEDNEDSTNLKLEVLYNDQIVLYPNPIKDILKIQPDVEGSYTYIIYDLNGAVIKRGNFTNNQTNLSELHSGYYLIKINKSTITYKIIKE